MYIQCAGCVFLFHNYYFLFFFPTKTQKSVHRNKRDFDAYENLSTYTLSNVLIAPAAIPHTNTRALHSLSFSYGKILVLGTPLYILAAGTGQLRRWRIFFHPAFFYLRANVGFFRTFPITF